MLQRLRQLFQPAHVRDFDPTCPQAGPSGWLALEPRILLDGALGETASTAFSPFGSPVVDLNGPTEAGRDYSIDYPDRETATAVTSADSFVDDAQDDIVRFEIVLGGDHIENMDAVRIGSIFVNHDRTESFRNIVIGGSRFDIDYDATTRIITLVDADDPANTLVDADLSEIVRGFRYGSLDLNARQGTLTFDFRAIDAEGNTSAPSQAATVIDSAGAFPYIELDPDRSSSTGSVFQATFREGDGLAITVADDDARIVSTTGEPIRQVIITLTAPQEGDQMRIQVPDDVNGITANIRTLENGDRRVTILTSSQAAGQDYADLVRVIQGVTFVNDSEDPSDLQRVVNIQLLEGNTYGIPTRLRLQVAPQNDAPTIDLDVNDRGELGPDYLATPWVEGEGGVAIISVGESELADVDDEVLQSATAFIANAEDGDRLFLDGGVPQGITATVSEDGTRVDFAGEASLLAYTRAIEAVRYQGDAQDPVAGTRFVRVSLNDGRATSNVATAVIEVSAENDPPTVVDNGPLSRRQDGIDSQSLFAVEASESFTDVDDDTLAYSFAGPAPNWLSIDALTGRITGRPDADASQMADPGTDRLGRYEVRVRATDSQGAFAEATVVYQIENPAPVAGDDVGRANDGGPQITGNVLTGDGADVDPDGDALVVGFVEDSEANVGEAVPGSTGGTFIVDADGEYSFDPGTDFLVLTPGESRTTSITYRVSDGQGGFDTASLVVTVVGTNNAPVARDDALTVTADRPVSGNVTIDNGFGADGDPDGDRIEVVQLNGEAIASGERVDLPSGVSLTLRSDGTYTYDPGRAFETLAVGENATDTFAYTVEDPFGLRSQATVSVSVVGTNEAPIPLDPRRPTIDPVGPDDPDAPPTDPDDPRASPLDPQDYIPLQTHLDGETINAFDLGRWFGDPDAGDVLTLSLDTALLPAGLAFDPATGAVTGTFAANASQGGRSGVYVVPVTATDPTGTSFTTNLTITVANPGPVAADDVFVSDRLRTLDADIFANNGAGEDVDPDGDALVVISPTDPISGSSGGLFTIGRDGSMSFDPGSDFGDLIRGETRDTTIVYMISDGEGGTSEATVTVTVGSENTPPRLDGVPAVRTGLDGEPIEPLDVAALVEDRDGDPLTFALGPNAPNWLFIDPDTGIVTGTPPADASVTGTDGDGRYAMDVLVSDGIDTLAVELVWRIGNPGPDAADDAFTTSIDRPVTGNVLTGPGADTDPDGDELFVIAPDGPVTGAVGGIFLIRPDGTMEFDPGNDFSDLGRGDTRATSVTYTVSDRQGGTATAMATVTVQGLNRAPETGEPAADRDGIDAVPVVAFDASEHFTDPDGDTLTYRLAPGGPDWLTIDAATGVVTGTPPNDASAEGGDGRHTITILASDGVASASMDVVWRIQNPGPQGVDDAARVFSDRETAVDLLANDLDPDGDRLRVIEIDGRPISPGSTLALATGSTLTMSADGDMTWGPSADQADMQVGETMTEEFTYTLVDAQGARSEASARVLVMGTQPVPLPEGLPPILPEDPQIEFPHTPTPIDPDGINEPILTTSLDEIAPLAPRIDLDDYPPVPILTQALERVERLGGDISLFGSPSLREALDRVAAGEDALGRWVALAGSAFEGHELTVGSVTFRTVVTGDVTHLDLGSFGGSGFERWRVSGDGGARLWLIDRNIVQIERPADRDHVHVDITARSTDGRTWRVPLRVDTVHGEVRAEGPLAPIEPVRRASFVEDARAALAPVALPITGADRVVDLSAVVGAGQCEVPVAAGSGGADQG